MLYETYSPDSNDIIGTSIDFDLNEIRYYKNGKDMGVAFRANKFPALHPCIRYGYHLAHLEYFRFLSFLSNIHLIVFTVDVK